MTVLNGHIHQIMQKVEGNVDVPHRAAPPPSRSPRRAPRRRPGPMKVPAEQLRSMLGLTSVRYVAGAQPLAIVDSSLESSASASAGTVNIDNFSFSPSPNSVKAGTLVTWINHDDIPHNIVATDKSFASPVLDTDEKFSHRFDTPGKYNYYCSLHPKMTGSLVVV